jgi:hypothetical protein
MHFLIFPIRSAWPANLVLLDIILRTMLDDEYKLWMYSLHNFLHLAIIPFLLDPNILLCSLFSDTFSLCCCLRVRQHLITCRSLSFRFPECTTTTGVLDTYYLEIPSSDTAVSAVLLTIFLNVLYVRHVLRHMRNACSQNNFCRCRF